MIILNIIITMFLNPNISTLLEIIDVVFIIVIISRFVIIIWIIVVIINIFINNIYNNIVNLLKIFRKQWNVSSPRAES